MKFICISGSSGVGKSTFSRLLTNVLSSEDTTVICGDDLHLWERASHNWKYFTHLHPDANNLKKNYEDVVELLQRKPIQRSRYNHETGKFDDPIVIENKNILIYEGLHALYDKPTYDLAQLKIYVDTDDNLKNEWKVKRDVKKRGYKKSEVDDVISRRINDEILYIKPQKLNANVLVKFSKVNDKIEMNYVCLDAAGEELLAKTKKFYDNIAEFVNISKKMAFDISLYQSSGGNISLKNENNIILTQSGKKITNINFFSGYVNIKIPNLDVCSSEKDYFNSLKTCATGSLPSMESGMHLLFEQKAVIHSHAIYANAILCSKESKSIIQNLFSEYNYSYVPYVTPGYELYCELKKYKLSPIVFLENHGVVVADNNPKIAFSILETINSVCKDWLYNNVDIFVDASKINKIGVLFPDAALFPEKTNHISETLLQFMQKTDLTPNFLTDDQIKEIKLSKFEIYRKSLQN